MANSVLLVDDEQTFRETVATFLREEGISVTAVANGAEALQAITKHPYPIAVIDLLMPGMDGISLLREIRKISPDTQTIMISAGGTDQVAAQAGRLGACDFLTKPIQFEQLLSTIRQHVAASSGHENRRDFNTDNLREATREFERKYITNVLERCHYDKVVTARLLGVGLSSLYRKILDLDIDVENKPLDKTSNVSDSTS